MKQEKSKDEQLMDSGKMYHIRRLLGHGKGGYSWLADYECNACMDEWSFEK